MCRFIGHRMAANARKDRVFALIRGPFWYVSLAHDRDAWCTICHPISPDPAQAQALMYPRVNERDPNPPHARQLLQPGSGVLLHPGGGARLLHGADHDQSGEPEPGTGRRALARGGSLRHGARHLVHAFYRHARLQPAHRAGIRSDPHRSLPGGGHRLLGLCALAGESSPAPLAPDPVRGRADGGRHRHHALHRHGGHEDNARHPLPAWALHPLHPHRGIRLGCRALDSVSPAQQLAPRLLQQGPRLPGDGGGHHRHALHRHGGGPVPRREPVRGPLHRSQYPVVGNRGHHSDPGGVRHRLRALHAGCPRRQALHLPAPGPRRAAQAGAP